MNFPFWSKIRFLHQSSFWRNTLPANHWTITGMPYPTSLYSLNKLVEEARQLIAQLLSRSLLQLASAALFYTFPCNNGNRNQRRFRTAVEVLPCTARDKRRPLRYSDFQSSATLLENQILPMLGPCITWTATQTHRQNDGYWDDAGLV